MAPPGPTTGAAGSRSPESAPALPADRRGRCLAHQEEADNSTAPRRRPHLPRTSRGLSPPPAFNAFNDGRSNWPPARRRAPPRPIYQFLCKPPSFSVQRQQSLELPEACFAPPLPASAPILACSANADNLPAFLFSTQHTPPRAPNVSHFFNYVLPVPPPTQPSYWHYSRIGYKTAVAQRYWPDDRGEVCQLYTIIFFMIAIFN